MSDELMQNDPRILQEKVFARRRSGLSIPEIADELGITEDEAVLHYNDYRLRISVTPRKREDIKDLYDSRYEHLISIWYPLAEDRDPEATKIVAGLMKEAVKIHQLDALDPADSGVTQNILIVGEDKAAFIEALRSGRGQVAVDEKMGEEEDEHE